ncbi:low specificity L-threonine aldolase [Enterococcus sp. 669A]|uniref:Low specificity L-threonine aldolase n=1 Tax=Candidatus Enterococcus moelleringii TaxID=2815325 RepID=A0ABS3L996_9ENTE|nr:low specificity L-threonine aldolase [Enterococcus sp. 669A]MBO1305628.1 low specificity L-threonine aldolase [Enterococcus sp. 669A]
MLSFENDYSEGAHEKVLQLLMETNMVQESGYGSDSYTQQAIEKIKERLDCPEAEIKFLVGGTQTNQIVITTLLKNYEGVLAADTGHVSTHEAGAIEAGGHKVLTLPHTLGKIDASQVKDYLETYYADPVYQHMVAPGMVYISQPTEYGTLYSLEELTALSAVCREYEIPLYMDGARLGYGLMSKENDVALVDIAQLCDVFYIGATKIGALCGEALVFTKKNMPKHFLSSIKQHGGLLAKGRLLGVQFLALFSDNLYFDISQNAIDMAELLKTGFKEKGYKTLIDSPTNQQFFIIDNAKLEELSEKVKFSFWEKYDDQHSVVRFATSWATTEEAVAELLEMI